MLRWLVLLYSLSQLLAGGSASADVAPPPGYVEPCVIEKICDRDEECVTCPADYHDFAAAISTCELNLGPHGFEKRCQTRGASRWDEVWCRASTAPDDGGVTITPRDGGAGTDLPIVQCTSTDGGCSCRTAGRGSAATWRVPACMALAGVVFLCLRSRRRSTNSKSCRK